jgi:ribosomal protein S18 acetylase RimI-like enzyme
MTVRLGNAGDLFTIMPMMRAYRALHEGWDGPLFGLRPDADARFHRWLGPAIEDPRAMLVVAEEGAAIVGFLAAVVETDLPIYKCDQYAVVIAMWVEPAFRRRGVATEMIDLAARKYAKMGIGQLRVRTAVANAAGRAMLEQAGFRAATVDLLRELGSQGRRKRARARKR